MYKALENGMVCVEHFKIAHVLGYNSTVLKNVFQLFFIIKYLKRYFCLIQEIHYVMIPEVINSTSFV